MKSPFLSFICVALLGGALCVGASGQGSGPAGQACSRPPLTLPEVTELVSAGVDDAKIRQHVSNCGVDFILEEREGAKLRAAGASDALLEALAPPARPKGGQEWMPTTDRREMVWIPAGSFQMGSPDGEAGRDPDEAQHLVRVEHGFWLDSMPVSYQAFHRFVVSNPGWERGRIDRSWAGALLACAILAGGTW